MTGQLPQRRELVPRGVIKDLPPGKIDENVLTDALNVESWDVGMRQSRGITEAFQGVLFPPEHLAFNKDANLFYWLYCSSAGIGITDGAAHFDISPTIPITSVWPATWTEAYLNTLIAINNGIDPPWYWDGDTAGPVLPLPDWPAGRTCNAMRAYKNNLLALGTFGAGGDLIDQILWSSSADPGAIPGSWTPLPTNDAGDTVLADTIGALLDGITFRDTFMLFKEHSTYLMNFIGGNFVFNFRKLFTTSGILTQNCAAEYLGNVMVMTDGDVIQTDGVAARSIIDKRMRSFIFNNIDSEQYRQAFAVSFHSENQVWFCFPEVGESECTLALVWDASDDSFGIRELNPKTPHIARGQVGNVTGVQDWDSDGGAWDTDTTTWNAALFNPTEDSLLQADRVNTKLYAVNEGQTYAGQTIESRVERIALDFGNNQRIKLVKALILRVSADAGTVFTVRVGSSNAETDPVAWSAPVTFTVGQSEPRIPIFAQGRYIAYMVESSNSLLPFAIHGIDFEFDWQGLY